MKPPLTLLEAQVLAYVSLRLDPWRGKAACGSRTVSQALNRLRGKGYVLARLAEPFATISAEGARALEVTFRWALYHRVQL